MKKKKKIEKLKQFTHNRLLLVLHCIELEDLYPNLAIPKTK